MDKDILRYYKRVHNGGRNTAARLADGIALRLVAAFACYLWYQSNVKNHVLALVLAGITFLLMLIALRLYRGLAFDKFVLKERDRIGKALLKEKLMLLSREDYISLCEHVSAKHAEDEGAALWCSQSAVSLNEDAILNAYKSANGAPTLIICTLSTITQKAEALLGRLPVKHICVSADELMNEARGHECFNITQEDIDGYIREADKSAQSRKKRMQTQPFSASSAKKYFIAALILTGASFITGYALYYRMLAALCATLGTAAYMLNRPTGGTAVNAEN